MTDFYQLTPTDQAERLTALGTEALSRWNIRAQSIRPIKMRENAVFDVTTTTGERVALRIHRAGYHSDAHLRSELTWMTALNDDGIDVPRVIPASDTGELFVVAGNEATGGVRQIDLFAWIDGEQLGSTEDGVNMSAANLRSAYLQLGQLAARTHKQAIAWQTPPEFARHAWNHDGLVGEDPFWGRFWDLARLDAPARATMQRVRTQLTEDLARFSDAPTVYSMIHADLCPENVMVEDGVVKLIDFDDCGYGWHMFDLATAVIFLVGTDAFAPACEALVEGYRSERAISDEMLAQWPSLLMARATTYLGWVHTRSETETAQELTGDLIELNLHLAEQFLSSRDSMSLA